MLGVMSHIGIVNICNFPEVFDVKAVGSYGDPLSFERLEHLLGGCFGRLEKIDFD